MESQSALLLMMFYQRSVANYSSTQRVWLAKKMMKIAVSNYAIPILIGLNEHDDVILIALIK